MAEANVPNVTKKRRSTGERGIQFSLNVELPRNQESRLLGMKDRIKMAKSCLNLSKATSSTQNADLLEALLLAFEEKMQRSKETSCVSSLLANQLSSSASTSGPSESPQSFSRPVATSTPRSRTSLAFDDPVSELPEPSSQSTESSPSPVYRPQRFQVSTLATQDDAIYFASEGALRSLFSFFADKLMAKCCFCDKAYDAESLSFTRQGHAVSVNMSCLCGDSIKWLSSPIMGGPTPKYYVNMRYVDIVYFTALHYEFVLEQISKEICMVHDNYFQLLFCCCRMIHGILSCGMTETQYTSVCQAANIGSEGEKTFDTGRPYSLITEYSYSHMYI